MFDDDAPGQPIAWLAGWLVGLAAVAAWFFFWIAVYPEDGYQKARAQWSITTAHVISVGEVRGNNAWNAYRVAELSYKDFYGREQVLHNVLLPYATRVGQREPMEVSRSGATWVQNDLNRAEQNPRYPEFPSLSEMMLGFFFIWVAVGIGAGFLAWFVLSLLFAAGAKARSSLARQSLVRLVGLMIKRVVRRVYDEARLLWEFYRRRKRLRATAAYRMVRRFQAELGRMDPTPSVIEARRKANELLTKVLERDNQRVEVIAGTVDEIRNDVDLDTEARQQAIEELAV
jgi:hypothetical protein